MRFRLIYTIGGCLRLVCNHPFLVGVVGFLIYLYRSTPFLFSLLVSASPIFICTAILLGTLLSFGELNLPDVEIEEKTMHVVISLKTELSGDATFDRNESYSMQRYMENGRHGIKRSVEESGMEASKNSDIDKTDNLDDPTPLVEKRSRVTELENEIIEGEKEDERQTKVNEETFSDSEVKQNQYSFIQEDKDEYLEADDGRSEAESFDSRRVYTDPLDSPPRSSWKPIEEREEEEEEAEEKGVGAEENETIDSGSDGVESSSLDASMADIIPMLDELHPLLDEDAPQHIQSSRGGSDTASECSPKSSTIFHLSDDESKSGTGSHVSDVQTKSSARSHESDDETRSSTRSHESDDEISSNHVELEVEDDENQDVEDEEEKEELSKPAITWTEEDQRNLMDLGSSEIERNQQLEKLLARRRARKNKSMVLEKNLIDLESSDPLFNIAPISTRKNPFDLPHDSYDNMELPPVPGSAPSVLLPQRNPFDIPYNSFEDKPILAGERFPEKFMTVQSSQPVFQRIETFSMGPSFFAMQERQDIKLRPNFVPEPTISQESNYSQFQGQPNELGNSQASFIPRTDSINLDGDLTDGKLLGVHISQDDGTSRTAELIFSAEEVTGRNILQEPVPISKIELISENVGHGSQSSEEEESSGLGQVKKRYVEPQIGDYHIHNEEGSTAQVHKTELQLKADSVEQRCSRGSSSSSLSEVSKRVFTEKAGEGSSVLDERGEIVAEEPGILAQAALVGTVLNITSELIGSIPRKEPLYDSSPPELTNNFSSSSSLSSGLLDMDCLPVLVKQTVPLSPRESESSEEMEDICNDIEIKDPPNDVDGNCMYQPDSYHQTESQASNSSCNADDNIMAHAVTDYDEDDKHSEVSDANFNRVVYHESNVNPTSTNYPDGEALSHSENDQASLSKTVSEQPFNRHSELQKIMQDRPNIESKEEMRTVNLNIPEVPEFDSAVPTNLNSPSTPEFISIPPNESESIVAEATSSHVNAQTSIEDAEEIKENDEGPVWELDSVGGFSNIERESSFNDLQEMESVSERPPSLTNVNGHTDLSEREFRESKIQNSLNQITSDNEVHRKESETSPANSFMNSVMPVVDARAVEEVEHVSENAESTSVESEIANTEVEGEVAHRNSGQETDIQDSVLEVKSNEDVTLDSEQIDNGNGKSATNSDSTEDALHVVDPRETQGATSELHIEEPIPPKPNGLVPNRAEEGNNNMEKPPKPKS